MDFGFKLFRFGDTDFFERACDGIFVGGLGIPFPSESYNEKTLVSAPEFKRLGERDLVLLLPLIQGGRFDQSWDGPFAGTLHLPRPEGSSSILP
jgi:hypothetical protein